ncbi:MAG: adenylyl-sulfate kinase [Candidatus Cloacimonadota bacterium]|nr:MAG: adenylyl-sulfate kinase [Candidatus Cloacimonadota bacterium]
MNKQENKSGLVLWLTGLSGAGKSSIAEKLVEYLELKHQKVQLLDGDLIRNFCPTGFLKNERNDHVKRVGFMASLLEKHGVIVIASLISPYQSARDDVRLMCKNYHEIYISTSLEICETRDVKGLYKKARASEIQNFTGVSDPYEIPKNPELKVQTEGVSVDESVLKVLNYLKSVKSI